MVLPFYIFLTEEFLCLCNWVCKITGLGPHAEIELSCYLLDEQYCSSLGFWSVLMTTSWHRWARVLWADMLFCTSYLKTGKDWSRWVKVLDAVTVKRWVQDPERRYHNLQESSLWPLQGSAWKNHIRDSSGKKRGQGYLGLQLAHFLQAQEQSIPIHKSNKGSGRPTRTKKLLLTEKKVFKWKEGKVTQKEFRDVAWLCRDRVRKAKANLEMNLTSDVKGNKMNCYNYISNKRKARENVAWLLSGAWKLVKKDMEKPEVLNVSLTSVFIGKICLQESQALETSGNVWSKDVITGVRVQVRTYLN